MITPPATYSKIVLCWSRKPPTALALAPSATKIAVKPRTKKALSVSAARRRRESPASSRSSSSEPPAT